MNTNCYDRRIAALQEYQHRNLKFEHTNTIRRAIVKLEESKIMSTVEDNLRSHAPAILEQLRHSNRGKTEMMKIMTKTMFSIITTQENQHFTEFDENMFSLKSTRGVYFFSLEYNETQSSVVVYRKLSKGEVDDVYGFLFKRFPRLDDAEAESDLQLVENILIKLYKRLSRGWKYLTLPKTPTTTTTQSESLSLEEEVNIALQYVQENM